MNKNKKKRWVLYSTPESFKNNSISILALFETVSAMIVYFIIAVNYGALHLTIAVIIAPLLLLRTKESMEYALQHSKSFHNNSIPAPENMPSPQKQTLLCIAIIFFMMAFMFIFFADITSPFLMYFYEASIAMFVIWLLAGVYAVFWYMFLPFIMRILATMYGAYHYPNKSISNIPNNWWAQIAYLDSMHPPEVLPGSIIYEKSNNRVSALQPYGFVCASAQLANSEKNILKKIKSILYIQITSIGYLTTAISAYFFRWSIKGTSVLLLPLVWLIFDAKTTEPKFYIQSTLMKSLFKGAVIICVGAIGALCLKLFGDDSWFSDSIKLYLDKNDPYDVISHFIFINNFFSWQIFIVITSVITVFSFLFAERLSIRGYSEVELNIFRGLLTALGFTAVCAIFSIVYAFINLSFV